uniref:Solute carrier family 7 member 4 n=1 Tax=Sphenodon punctatus TaxID=8508 RepID=A0A8D0H9B4_SPHPU
MVSRLPRTADLARFCQKLNRVKTLEEDMMETSFNRCLSTVDLTLLGIGGMVGSGLYVLTGTVAKEIAGPAVIVSFIIAGFASLLAALCYAEFGARVPKTGSAYMFTYVSVGELWAFLIGWNVLLEYMIGGAAVARAWSGYLDSIFSHKIKNFTETHIGTWQVPFLAHYPDFLAAGILLIATVLISFGAKVSSWLNHVFSAVSIGVILFILIMGFILAEPKNWSAQEGGFAPYGLSGIMSGTATCFYAFVGFDVIATSSEEARNPQRAIPRAIAISLSLATGAYILVSVVLTLMVPWHTLDPESALADAFYRRGYSWAGFIVAAGSICGRSGKAGPSSLLLILFCNVSGAGHSRGCETIHGWIHRGGSGGFSTPPPILFWLSFKVVSLENTFVTVTLFWSCRTDCKLGSIHVPICSLTWRVLPPPPFSQPVLPLQIPLVPLTPSLSILLNIYLMLKLSYLTWLRFSIWLIAGLLVYFGYGIWHSKENLREPQSHNVSARYVVFPSGSLEETVQAVQPTSQHSSLEPVEVETEEAKR